MPRKRKKKKKKKAMSDFKLRGLVQEDDDNPVRVILNYKIMTTFNR